MSESRQREAWCRQSAVMALIANTQRDPRKSRAFRPEDFNPFTRRAPQVKADISILKDVFLHGKMPPQATEGTAR